MGQCCCNDSKPQKSKKSDKRLKKNRAYMSNMFEKALERASNSKVTDPDSYG